MAVFPSRQIFLPKQINFVNYIQSDGNQYINTGINPTQNYRVICDFQMSSPSGWQCLMGASDDQSNTNSLAFWHTPSSGFAYYYGTNTSAEFGSVTEGVGTGTRNVVDCNKNIATITKDEKSYSVTVGATSFTCAQPIYLFGVNYGGSMMFPNSGCKIYSCQIYDNGTLVRDLWPCLDEDGVACMYDKVTKEYYYNAGSGEFIAGGAA